MAPPGAVPDEPLDRADKLIWLGIIAIASIIIHFVKGDTPRGWLFELADSIQKSAYESWIAPIRGKEAEIRSLLEKGQSYAYTGPGGETITIGLKPTIRKRAAKFIRKPF